MTLKADDAHPGFTFRFTAKSAFYSPTGDPGNPVNAVDPGATFLVVRGELRNLVRDRPAPPYSVSIANLPGIVVAEDAYRHAVARGQPDDRCSWRYVDLTGSGEGDPFQKWDEPDDPSDAGDSGEKDYFPGNFLEPAKNVPHACAEALNFRHSLAHKQIPANSSIKVEYLTVVPDRLPKSAVKLANVTVTAGGGETRVNRRYSMPWTRRPAR